MKKGLYHIAPILQGILQIFLVLNSYDKNTYLFSVRKLCSPYGTNKEIVEDGVHGFWAETPDEWIEKIEILAKDHDLRKKMGTEGRKKVIENYSLEVNAPRMLKIFQQLTPDNANR